MALEREWSDGDGAGHDEPLGVLSASFSNAKVGGDGPGAAVC
jgi:hypothetical protein